MSTNQGDSSLWIELMVTCPTGVEELVAELLREHGAGGVVLQDTLDDDRQKAVREGLEIVSAYYAPPVDPEELSSRVRTGLANARALLNDDDSSGTITVRWQPVETTNWAENWKQYYHVTRVDDRLVVVPAWQDYRSEDHDVVLRVDPGMAFGSGTHDSTRLALRGVHETIRRHGSPKRMLDVGTGSGILAIAALKLGAGEAVGVDIDHYACERASHNARLNGVERRFAMAVGDLAGFVAGASGQPADWYAQTGTSAPGVAGRPAPAEFLSTAEARRVLEQPFDLVTANLTPDLLKYLAVPLRRVVGHPASLVLSGITVNREQELITCFREQGFRLEERLVGRESEWVSLALRSGGARDAASLY